MLETIDIKSRAYWFKVVEMLQQNWALIEEVNSNQYRIYFISDTSGVFDEMNFNSLDDAISSLERNGFRLYSKNGAESMYLNPPEPPFQRREHPNGKIYSSGMFWI